MRKSIIILWHSWKKVAIYMNWMDAKNFPSIMAPRLQTLF